jgi:hypothetical protein
MEIMTAKEFLKQYEEADRKARQHRAEYERELEMIGSLSVKMDGMPHGSNISKPTEEAALKLADRALKWKEAEENALRIRQEVYDTICNISGIEGRVLYERYINLHKWEEICILVHYSWNGIHHVHRRALQLVEEMMVLNGTHIR